MILTRSQGLSSTMHDAERQCLACGHGASHDNVQHFAMLQRRRLGKSLRMLSQAKERLRVLIRALHHWGRITGTWISRQSLCEALACKALLAISPVPPHLHSTSGMIGAKRDDGEEAVVDHEYIARHPTLLYAKVRTLKQAMDRWEWMVRWRRTKLHLRRRHRDGALHVSWKVWCLAISQLHLFRHAALKIIWWTSVRYKGMCFRAWAVKSRHAISTRERSLWKDISW